VVRETGFTGCVEPVRKVLEILGKQVSVAIKGDLNRRAETRLTTPRYHAAAAGEKHPKLAPVAISLLLLVNQLVNAEEVHLGDLNWTVRFPQVAVGRRQLAS
jgi:hypothetical protein